MAVVNFDKATDESVDGKKVLKYLAETNSIGSLRELSCSQVFTDQLIEEFSFALQRDPNLQLKSLKLRNNHLTANAAPALANILRYTSSTLQELDLSENQVRAVGLQSLVHVLTLPTCQLKTLNLSNNKLDGGKEGTSALAVLIKENSSIETLLLSQNNLRHRRIKAIAASLCKATESKLRYLDLTQNTVEDRGAHAVAEALSVPHCALESLILCQNKIRYKGASYIANALCTNKSLKTLDLSNNCIGPEGAEAFAVVLKFSHILEELNLSRNNIGDSGIAWIAQGLKSNPDTGLKRLDVSWNGIKDEGAEQLSNMLKDNSQLVFLSLKSNFICDPGILSLAISLPYSMSLAELDLTGNQMRDPSSLVDALCHHKTKLQKLHCEQNHLSPRAQAQLEAAFTFRENKRGWLGKLLRDIKEKSQVNFNLQNRNHSDEEIICLSQRLAKYHRIVNTAEFGGSNVTHRGVSMLASDVISTNAACLQRLYIRKAPHVGDIGTTALSQGLALNHTLRCLCLTGCNISSEGARELASALRQNITLARLSLRSNRIGDEGFQELCAAILTTPAGTKKKKQQSPQLQSNLISLNMGDNCITDIGLSNMPMISHLEELFLDGNDISDRGALDLAKAFMGQKCLKWLDLEGNRELTWRGVETLKMFLHKPDVLDFDSTAKKT